MSDTPKSERSLFLEAIERSPEERAAFLNAECGENERLRLEVEALLRAHDQSGDLLDTPDATSPMTCRSITEKPGTQIGPYKLLEPIDQGGMGVVYLAEQAEPVRRQVALKIIKPGMDTQQVIKRFEAERQALALMDHPNIAKVFDAGATETGRPYFVMEWVKGVPITQYCDEHQLTPRERLEIFATVCQAVQHSHQKGIIHRDIKPSNVLVSESDGRPIAKVIDFGLAKAMGPQLIDKTAFTQQGQIIGTVEYMSPEQADLNPVDVDTRTDIYSLGVLLYELLTGETPFDRQRLRSAAFNELLRIIREEDPPKPSMRLSSSEALPSIAANRHCEPKKLSTLVRGELDWIAMKALEKDRTRRYETANGLASDINRYLNDEAVEACPPSAGYRFRKFARRNKAVLAAAAAILICLLAGITGTTLQALRATKAEATAVAERDNKELARREAETNAKRAREAAESERLAKEAESHQRRLATAASEKEKQQRKEAERLRLVAEEKELLARRNLYAAHMNLAQQALEKGHTTRVHRLLERHVPIPEEPDWRQFEWYYLLGECHRNQWEISASTLSNAAFSPNGREVAVPNRSNIEIWNLSTRQRIQVLEGDPQQYLYALAFSPDGTQLVSGAVHRQDEASDCVVWDTWSWKQVRKLSGIEHAVPSIEFSPNGKLIAVGDGGHYDRQGIPSTIRLYEAKTGDPVGEFVGHTRMVTSLAFDPSGRRLASTQGGEWDDLRALRIWDVQTGQEVKKGSIRGERVDWSPKGRLLATAGPHAIWDADTGEMIHELLIKDQDRRNALGISFSPDGKQLAFAMQRDNSVQVWDVDTGDRIAVLKGHANWVWRVAYSPDSRWLASTGWDGTVKLWDADFGNNDLLPGGEAPWEFKHARGRNHIAVSADGSTLAATQDLTTVAILDLHSLETQTTLDAGATIRAVSLSSDGKFLAVGTESSLQLWDVAKRQKTQHKNGAVKSLCYSSTGKELFVAAGKRVDVVEIDRLRTLRVVSLPESPFVDMVCASPDGRHLALIAPNFQGKVYVWDLTVQALRATFEVSRWTTNLAFSPDGITLAASGGSWFDARSAGVTKLWDLQTLREISTFKAHDGLHTALAFSPDGNSLATASDTAELTIWDLETSEERITFHWGTHPIDCLTFSKDGQTLISGNNHEAVKLWRSASTRDVLACEQAASLAIVSRYLQAGDWERVASVSTKLIELEDQPNLRQMRGEAYAELGRWEEASDDLRQIAELYPLDHRLWYQLALTQLAAGDHHGHEKTVATMLANHQSSSNPTASEQAAWAAVLHPTRETNWRAALRSGLSVAESQADPRLADVAVGTALYRGARFQNAVEWMTELCGEESINNEFSPACGWLVLAMAHHRLGQYQQAQHWFGEASRRCQEELDGQEVVPWDRRFTLNWLQKEAELTLQQPVAETTERSIPIALDQGDGNELHNQFCAALYRRRARRLAAENHWKEAAESIRKIPKLQNIDSALLIKVARALLDQNEGREAAVLLSKATQFTSNSLEQWTELIELTERVGNAHPLQAVVQDAMNSLSEANRLSARETHQLREFALSIGQLGFHDESIAMLEATSASWERLRKADPTNPELAKDHAHTLVILTNVHAGTDKERYLSEAVASAQLALELIREQEVPKNVIASAHSILGELYRIQGRQNDALRELEKALAIDAQKAATHHRLVSWFQGVSPMEPVHKKKAAQHAITAFDLKPDVPSAPTKCEACVIALQESIKNGESGDALSHYLVAAGLTRLDHLGSAVAYWQRAEELVSTTKSPLDDETSKWRDDVRATITHLLDDQGRLQARDPGSKDDPGWQRNVDLLVDYGSALQQLGRLGEAIEAYARILAISPRNYRALMARGNAYLKQSQHELSISDLALAVEVSGSIKEEFDSLYARATASLQAGEFASAIADLERARSLLAQLSSEEVILVERLHVDCHLGTAYLRTGQEEAARRLSDELKSRYSQDPDPWSKSMLAWYFTMVPSLVDDWEEVVELAREDIAIHPNWCWSQLTLAWALLLNEDNDEAAGLLGEIKPIEMDPEEIELVEILLDFKRDPSADAQTKLDQLRERWNVDELLPQYRLQNALDMISAPRD